MVNLQIVVFTLNGETCGADTEQVKQIIKYQEPTKVPQMPEFIDGVLDIRGAVVPVINLNKRLELGDTVITKKTKIILIEIDKKLIGFTVNDIKELMKYEEADVESLPGIINEAGNNYMSKVIKKNDDIISIIDFSLVLTEKEIKNINT